MRKMILTLVALSALALPIAAMADDAAPTAASAANQLCKQEQTKMGAAAFAAAYGTNSSKSNAFGKCVAKNSANAAAAVDNAAKACRTERAADAGAFAKKYGTNGKPGGAGAGSNAFGKCVSQKAKAATDAEAAKAPSAAKQCKALAKSDPAGYATSYGKDKNALGKCVAAKSHGK